MGKKDQDLVPVNKLPRIVPNLPNKLRLLRVERVKDYLTLENEYLAGLNHRKVDAEAHRREKEVDKLRGSPLIVATIQEVIGDRAVITIGNTPIEWLVPILSIVDRQQVKPNMNVLLGTRNFAVVGAIEDPLSKALMAMKLTKLPRETFEDIGGMESQILELREAVELPLTHLEYFEALGIKPPKGVILYGPPGTGKTLLAKAVANSTSASFLHTVASELVQKNIGEGPKLVRDMFKVAEENAPTIVFIDEIDAIGGKRSNSDNSGGEREIQRTMLELLNQLDGFEEKSDIKVILATNAVESLDPALIRPGRIDRKIEIPLPNYESRKRIFEIHSNKMSKVGDIDLDEIIKDDTLSGADIQALCTEAGLNALRAKRMKVNQSDFTHAKSEVCKFKERLKRKDYDLFA
ncbi:26S proteasome regulatory subunit 4-like [Brevipalpus obovatus]|uniref:26S proteasome regulatory subunit 4-like n=1 Tax=Brevipalpus obovatus TaxID=246614 RepID=UPI003D9E4047